MVAVPTVIMGAYKERENIFKTVVYLLAFSMLIYLLWKIFKAFQSLGKLDDAIKKGIEEAIEGLKNITKPVTPKDTAKKITEEASKEPNKPYYVEKTIYDELTKQGYKLPENVKPTTSVPKSKYYEEEKKRADTIGSWTGIGDLGAYKRAIERTKEEEKVKPKTVEEHMELEGKRWEAKADYYSRNLHLIANLDPSRYYKIIYIDAKGLMHERIMKGADIKADKTIYKVISVLPMPRTYKPTPTPLPIEIKPIDRALPIRRLPIAV